MKRLHLACLAMALAWHPFHAKAASNASDVASNYAGLNTYQNVNRGTGWLSGYLGSNSNVNAFLGSSGQIDTNGISFGLSNGGVSRYFKAQAGGNRNLGADQIFEFELQPAAVAPGGQFGFNVVTTVDLSAQVKLQYTSGDANYALITTYYSQSGTPTTLVNDTGVPFSTNALAVSFCPGAGSYKLTLTPAGSATTTLTNPYSGSVIGCNFSATSGTTVYFNDLAVVPEPKASAVLAFGLLGLVVVYVRRDRIAQAAGWR